MTEISPQMVDASLRANRAALTLLDQQIVELSKVLPSVTEDLKRARQALPFSYVVDFSESGLAAGTTWTSLYGFVRVDSDSDFALDGIFVNRALITSVSDEVITGDVNVAITEVNSGRDITVVGRDERIVPAGSLPTPLGVSMTVFSTFNQLARGKVEMPTEGMFPRNALLRVELTAQVAHTLTTADSGDVRNFMVLHGTKYFGG